MATLIIRGHSINMPIDQAYQAMGDAILQGIPCQLWQGMNRIAVWTGKEER